MSSAVLHFGRELEIIGVEVSVSIEERIDWSECSLVEIKPGVQSGAPVLRGTRCKSTARRAEDAGGSVDAEVTRQVGLTKREVGIHCPARSRPGVRQSR